jgi:ATP-dependent RNA helicase SUPV3L1/SUV3
LPYDVRHEQAELFATGQTDIVVATDAIGMGMNLPIRRVVFLEQVKYDGMEKRKLLPSEYKQIAGRAGRLGMYDKGYATVCNDKKGLKKALESKEESLSLAVISFPEVLLGIDADLSTIIERWIDMDVQEGYRKAVADRDSQPSEYRGAGSGCRVARDGRSR